MYYCILNNNQICCVCYECMKYQEYKEEED